MALMIMITIMMRINYVQSILYTHNDINYRMIVAVITIN